MYSCNHGYSTNALGMAVVTDSAIVPFFFHTIGTKGGGGERSCSSSVLLFSWPNRVFDSMVVFGRVVVVAVVVVTTSNHEELVEPSCGIDDADDSFIDAGSIPRGSILVRI